MAKSASGIPAPEQGRLDDRPTAKRILDAAGRLFFRKGYSQASVQDVADAVGILKGSLYYYIDSKEDLLARLIEGTQAETLAIVDEIAAMTELPPLERLRLYIERQVAYNARNIDKITVYYRDMELLSAERRKRLLEDRRRNEDFVVDLVEEARAEGAVVSTVDARLLSYCAFGTTNWMYKWYRPSGPVKAEDLAAAFAEFVVAGVVGSRDLTEAAAGAG